MTIFLTHIAKGMPCCLNSAVCLIACLLFKLLRGFVVTTDKNILWKRVGYKIL